MKGITISKENLDIESELIPNNWQIKKLRDLISYKKGKKPKFLSEIPLANSIPYLTAEYFRKGIIKLFVDCNYEKSPIYVKGNDIVFIWDGSNAGDVFTGLEGILASTMVRIRAHNDDVENFWLYFFLMTKFELFNSQTTGSTIPHINKNLFLNLQIPLPSLPEQRAIAHVLRTVQEAREKTEAVIEAAKTLKKSMMQYLFTYGPVPIDEAEQVPLKETEVGMVPEGWEVMRMKEICESIIDCPHSTPEYTESGYLVIRTSNVREGRLCLESPSYTSKEGYFERITRGEPKEGDVLLSREAPIGEACIVPPNVKLCLGQRMMLLKPDETKINGYFLVQAIYSKNIRRFLLTKGTGVTAKHLNVGEVKKQKIPIPFLETQRHIKRILISIDQKIAAEESRKAALDHLFQSLLHDLMTAKIRVNHISVPVAET